jgi:farnesyl diphosphate synthase
MVHAYSLAHDDLPAMDDDDLRRGRATCHIEFDEAMAILAGDALQSRALEIIASDHWNPAGPAKRARMVEVLAHAIGSCGMAGGQALDMEATGNTVGFQ